MSQQHVAKLRVGERDPQPGPPDRYPHVVWVGDGTLLPEQGYYFRVEGSYEVVAIEPLQETLARHYYQEQLQRALEGARELWREQ